MTAKDYAQRLSSIKACGRKKLDPDGVYALVIDYKNERDTLIKREIISVIGRQRDIRNIDILIDMSMDDDPKLVLQALRGMFYFKNEPKIKKRIDTLKRHQNEIIREFIQKNIEKKRKYQNHYVKSETQKMFENKIIGGDASHILKNIEEEIVDLTFTSPPYYNARDYSIYKSYEEYLSFLEKVFHQVYNITKQGRFFVLNTSPVILPRTSRQDSSKRYAIPFDIHSRLLNMGFEFIDDIIWKKPDPSAKNRNGGFYQHRKPLGYKPNIVIEYVMVYRKKTNKLLDWNMKQYDKETIEKSKVNEEYNMTNVWNIGASSSKAHPAVFPQKLVDNVLKFYSYVDDLILDPFAGSGTVGVSCIKNNRKYLLIEKESEYIREIKRRLID